MSTCNRCRAQIGWTKVGAKNVPMEQDGVTKHECAQNCRECSALVLWVDRDGRRVRIDADTKKDHVCARVSDWLTKPTGHHGSASRFKLYGTCQFRFYNRSVLGLPDNDESGPEAQTGKLLHAAGLEVVGLTRWRDKRLTDPVTESELRSALESPAVLAKEQWTPAALNAAHELVPRVAARLDFSFLVGDEHGPLLERKFVVPVGGGVEVGGIVDMVERIPGDGKRRDPLEPAREGDVLVIPDLKTGKHVEATAADGFYGTWARLMWPGNAVVVVRNYVALDIKPVQVAGERLDRAVRESHQLARAIVVKARTAAGDPDAWPATPGAHCAGCAFQAGCSAFQTAQAKALAPDLPVGKKQREAAIPTTRAGLLAAIEVAEERDAFARPVSEWLRTLRSAAKKVFADQVRADGTAEVGEFGVEVKTSLREAYDVEDGVQTRIKVWRLEKNVTEVSSAAPPRELGADPVKDRAETVAAIEAAGTAAGLAFENAIMAEITKPSVVDHAVELDPQDSEFSLDAALPLGKLGRAVLEASVNAQGRVLPKGADEDALRTETCSGSSAIGGRDGAVSSPEAESTPVVSGEVARGNGRAPSLPTQEDVLRTARIYREPTADDIEALANVERTPETLGVVALAKALALPCGGKNKKHRWAKNGDPRCERCGTVPKKKRSAGSLPAPSSSPGETGDDPASPGAPPQASPTPLSPIPPDAASASSIPDPCPSCLGRGYMSTSDHFAPTACRDCKGASGSGQRDPRLFPTPANALHS